MTIEASRQSMFGTRLYRTVYGWTISLFFVWQALFLFLLKTQGLGSSLLGRGPEDLLTVSLSTAVYLVVAVNTLVFLVEAGRILGPLVRDAALDPKKKGDAEGSYQAFFWFLIVATFLAGMLGLFIFLGGSSMLDSRRMSWKSVLRINEVASVVVYGWFFLANACAQRSCRIVLTEVRGDLGGRRESIERFYGEMKLLFMAVDCPGFLGLVFIAIVSHLLYPGNLQFFYWHGFMAGAIALHIAFSQIALALIAARDEGSRFVCPVNAGNPGAVGRAQGVGRRVQVGWREVFGRGEKSPKEDPASALAEAPAHGVVGEVSVRPPAGQGAEER